MIYIVEDDANIRELVVYTMQSTGFTAEGFESADAFRAACKKRLPDLIILDIMLPGDDGLAILKQLRMRNETKQIPVMMLTAKGSEYDKVTGLDLGADDYLAKPAGMMELIARVKSLLRRAQPKQEEKFSLADVSVDVGRHTVSAEGNPVTLTNKEFDLLVFLIRNKGLALSREQILQSVWGTDFEGESRTVDTHILTLRTKLGGAGHIITTIRGVGYKAEDV
ncbi:MAG: response regulator transcription factor [Oscillospiraceae bacterium]|jgi:two-component system alkaline phosphatase synthesis response regulator PhoP|nr:response regulator transcription factor [Oscillospiraceae bacterium]